MIAAITSALGSLITMLGNVVTSIVTTDAALNPLLPVFAIGIAVSVVLLGVKVIRSICWGA